MQTTSDTAFEMTWEEPPEVRDFVSYAGFYQNLKGRPGKWARYPGTQSAASQWCEKYPEFEYRSATVDGVRLVWMRHVAG